MKRSLLILSVLLCLSVNAFSQALIHIDSVIARPANPVATDPVYLHIYGWCGYGAGLSGPPTVLNAGFTHTVDACYVVGLTAVITDIHDSVYLFTGPSGVHSVYWNIEQNVDQFTPVCDTQITSGAQTVNVLTTSLGNQVKEPFSLTWNPDEHALCYSSADLNNKALSVYTVNGQLIAKMQLTAGNGKLTLPATADGLFIVALEDENGFQLRRKIYCPAE